MKLSKNHERRWGCAYPGCTHTFTSTVTSNDVFFCKKHAFERRNLHNKIRYHVKKNKSQYYRKKRVLTLRKSLDKQEQIEKDIFKTLQIQRNKLQIIISELDMLEDMGVRV